MLFFTLGATLKSTSLEYAPLVRTKSFAYLFTEQAQHTSFEETIGFLKENSDRCEIKIKLNEQEANLCSTLIKDITLFLKNYQIQQEQKKYSNATVFLGSRIIHKLTILDEALKLGRILEPLFTGSLISYIVHFLITEISKINTNNLLEIKYKNYYELNDQVPQNLALLKTVLETFKELNFNSYHFGLLFEAIAFGSIKSANNSESSKKDPSIKHKKILITKTYQEIFQSIQRTPESFNNFLYFISKFDQQILFKYKTLNHLDFKKHPLARALTDKFGSNLQDAIKEAKAELRDEDRISLLIDTMLDIFVAMQD